MSHHRSRICALLLLLGASPAFAHPGHQALSSGLAAGLLHPLLGIDHLLAMVAVGVWAAQLGGHARWRVPASFIAVMTLGAALAMRGYVVPQLEAGIAASLIVLGVLIAVAVRLPAKLAMLIVAAFALFHGAAHGQELPALAHPLSYAAGFTLATTLLHALGVLGGQWLFKLHPAAVRIAGALTAVGGVALACAA